MLTAIPSSILQQVLWWAVGVLLFLVISLGAAVAWQHGTITDLEATVTSQGGTIATLEGEKASLDAALDHQTASVTKAKQDAEKASADAATELAQERRSAQKWRDRYSGILHGKKPSGDDCGASDALLNQYLSIRKEEGK